MKIGRHLHITHLAALLAFALYFSGARISATQATPNDSPWEEGIGTFTLLGTVEGSSIDEIARILALAIERTDDTSMGMAADWRLAGYPGYGPVMHSVLKVPGGHRVLELTNEKYASMALGFGHDKSLGMPVKMAVVKEGGVIKIILLNPEAVFSLFFRDLPRASQVQMEQLAQTVQNELEDLVDNAMTGFFGYWPQYLPLGHVMIPSEMAVFQKQSFSRQFNFPVPKAHRQARETFREEVIASIIAHATHEEMPGVGSMVEGLSVADWRAARSHPIKLVDGTTVIEMCSPTYAKAALKTGIWHAPALPCKIAVYFDKGLLTVAILDTDFMFPTFFGDTPAKMGAKLKGMSRAVSDDLSTIVQASYNSLYHLNHPRP
ncbi:hypothetical protein KKF84_12835 [Myxococcota bacterium]|nr:hypothetical protein [Myxococcota bacterium]MBU1536202.1 hypothetical protein [Myxococcota bacterium]